jgi:hypothetical protein
MHRATSRSVLALTLAFVASATHADPRPTPAVTCQAGGMNGSPKFTQVSPGRAEYSFSGLCTTRDGRSLGYRAEGTWTPSEANPINANASEIYRIDTLSGPSQSFLVVLGARCDKDPWLNHATCTRVGDNVPDELRDLWPELAGPLFPYSRSWVPYAQRDALRAEYDRANGKRDRAQALMDGISTDSGGKHAAATARTSGRVPRTGEEVMLNPQSLPPVPADAQVQPAARAAGRADRAGIIIVSGKTPYQNAAKKAPPATAAADKAVSP